MSLGIEIKQARARRRINAKTLAEAVGISQKYLSQIEADKAPGVTAQIVKRICEKLQVSADRLLEIPAWDEERKQA